ncbi:CoA transferase subunit A [Streptomyces sp. TP-A0874]|uniref:CoA transferase subunit A n=1 Tax=Streptomyces sp. TP-A0874 TaxID=549819 RepID=UPI00085384CD|nr:CoA-transferase [Streptomyces sp. TP-A0874]
MTTRSSKRRSLSELAALVSDGDSITLGGSFLHRGPNALVRELIRQARRDLEIVKQSPGYDIDLLCRAGVATRAKTGIVAMEGNYGLAPHYRRAIESGALALEEHACATLTAGLRAAAFGVPFQPCAGIDGSDLARLNGWVRLDDPYQPGRSAWVIPEIRPDVAVIHVNEVTPQGDARVTGTTHWDRIMTRAAGKVLVVAEREVPVAEFQARPELTLVPHFLVEAYAVVPGGAWPGSCWPEDEVDYPAIDAYLEEGEAALQRHLAAAPETKEATRA